MDSPGRQFCYQLGDKVAYCSRNGRFFIRGEIDKIGPNYVRITNNHGSNWVKAADVQFKSRTWTNLKKKIERSGR